MANPGIDNSPATRVVSVDADGNPVFGSAGAGSNVNVADINGVAPLMGAGNTGTGSPRVTIATDQAALPVTTVVPGTAATNLGKAEDAAHTSGDTGVMSLGVGNVAQTALASDGDYIPQATDTAGNTLTVGNVAAAATDSGNPVKVGGNYSSTLPTLTNGQRGNIQLDSGGRQLIQAPTATGTAIPPNAFYIGIQTGANLGGVQANSNLADASNGTGQMAIAPWSYNGSTYDRLRSGGVTGMLGVIPQASPTGGASFLNIAAGQATTTVKSGAGTLYTIVFNSAATATNTTTIYDNTAASGTVIAIPAATTATVPTTLNFGPAGIAFATGLTVITATANGSNMTFVYK